MLRITQAKTGLIPAPERENRRFDGQEKNHQTGSESAKTLQSQSFFA